ncbi:MAG: hypothetical protein ACRD35_01355 [Candidatus Acidiferrales bacterium]
MFTGGRVYVGRRHAIEASYSYGGTEFRRRAAFPTALSFLFVPVQTHNVAFNYVLRTSQKGRFRTFVTGGLGFTVYDLGFGFERVHIAGNLGGGFDLRLCGPLSGRVELRDFVTRRLQLGRDLDPGGIVHNVTPTAGLAVRF